MAILPEDRFTPKELAVLTANFFKGDIGFVKGVVDHDGFPEGNRVEICFAGRSNVGKSSLINAIVQKKGLARASNTPGRTQEINYFYIGDSLYMVDLPGYGYAEAPKDIVRKWNYFLRDYLVGRRTLRRAFVLIDSRHGVMKNDEEIFEMMDKAGVNYQIILTKTDKIKPPAVQKLIEQIAEKTKKHPAAHPKVFATSSDKNWGIEELRQEIFFLQSY